eukprot:m.351458 g.351458  ORF g.351458 m.351458 type:complete len:1338 (-) comp27977_c1_seq4:1879-5892(-)
MEVEMSSEMSVAEIVETVEAATATAPPGMRLVITKMVLHNFKSYYGNVEVGPFHKCFSSVVGPNGSGKSNVIDAMLFVFGFRAKKIRQGKLSGLIHNSENHSDVPSCSVAVHFAFIDETAEGQSDDDLVIVPGSEVVVKREARQDNTSTYSYNGKKIVFKELAKKLRELGIDLDHNRFLILQGEVEAISMMPPKGKTNDKGETVEEGMLEYLEDIIGSNVFIELIKACGGELEVLQEARNHKLTNVKAVEKEKDELETGKDEAEAYLSAENAITVKQSELYQKYAYICEQNHTEAGEKYQTELATKEEAQATLKVKESEMAIHETEHSTTSKDYQSIKAAAAEAKNKFTAIERLDVKHRQNDKDARTKGKKLDKAIREGETTVGEATAKLSAVEEDKAKYVADLTAKEGQLEKEEDKLSDITAEGSGEKAALKEKLDVKQVELEPFTAEVDAEQSKANIIKEELELLTKANTTVAAQLEDATANLARAQSTESDRQGAMKVLHTQHKENSTKLAAEKAELASLIAEEAPLIETVRSKRARVEEAKSVASNNRSQSKVLQTLMAEGRPGVYGRLGNLGAIDDTYDAAITTSCGALNNVICATVADAQWCINLLKSTGAGRVTCICLDKMERWRGRVNEGFNAPAGTDRLFDLVRVKDDRFLTAFYHALRDTLVAPDLDTATKVAYSKSGGGNQVVTLEGQVISSSGTMSGGGNRPARGGMSAKIADDSESMTPQQITKLEKSLETDVQSLSGTRNRKLTLEQSIKALTKQIGSFNTELQKMEMDIASAKKAMPELKALIVELKRKQAEMVKDSSKIDGLESALKKQTKVLDAAKAAAETVETEIKEIKDAIKNVGGVRLKAQKSKVKSMNSQMDKLRSNITKAGVDIKTMKSQLKKVENKLIKDKAELEKTVETRAQIKVELATMDETAAEVQQDYKEAKAMFEQKEAEMKDIAKKHTALETECNTLRGAVIDLEENCKAMKATVKENQHKMKSWRSKVAKLKLHKIGSDYFEDESDEGECEGDVQVAADSISDDTETADAAAVGDDVEGGGEEVVSAEVPAEGATESPSKRSNRILQTFTAEHLATVDDEQLEYDINILQEKLGKKKHNAKAIQDFYAKEEEYIAKVSELDEITEKRDALRSKFDDMRKARLEKFFAGFKIISTKLKEMYQMITLGGDAELEYVDNINPFSEGIVFSVRPPRKSWKAIQNLSGGEKTLSSLALVFALHHFKPTPLYVMDEIDAALDFKNVSIVAHYIKERTKNAQFIIISLRNNMFELADRLVGIYKTDNSTKTVTINPHLMAEGTHTAGGAPGPVKVHADAAASMPPVAPLSVGNH